MFLDAPRGLSSPEHVAERELLLAARPEVQLLRAYAEALAARRKVLVPRPDPADAGVEARVLIVLESPVPRTVQGTRSGFISVDNDDPTAENLWHARNAAGLHENRTAIWNIVPWYLEPPGVHPKAAERASGAAELRRFMLLLPELRVVVLAGRHAQDAWNAHIDHLLAERPVVILVPLPSLRGLNQPGARERLARGLERAASYL